MGKVVTIGLGRVGNVDIKRVDEKVTGIQDGLLCREQDRKTRRKRPAPHEYLQIVDREFCFCFCLELNIVND